MLIDTARVSMVVQNLDLLHNVLTEVGCARICTEQMSGAVAERPELMAAIGCASSFGGLSFGSTIGWRAPSSS